MNLNLIQSEVHKTALLSFLWQQWHVTINFDEIVNTLMFLFPIALLNKLTEDRRHNCQKKFQKK